MKKFFTSLFAIFLLIGFVGCSAAEKSEKIKFNSKLLKQVQLTESPARDKPIVIMRDDLDELTILGEPTATQSQMVKFILQNNPEPKLNCSVREIVKIYYDEGAIEGIRPDVALCQAIKETGFWNYGGDVSPEQNNFCGLGATGNKEPGASFDTPQLGARAHLQHLLAYTSTRPPKTAIVDPRYLFIVRFKPEVFGKIKTWAGLGGVWAMPGINYGEEIVKMWRQAIVPDGGDETLAAANKKISSDPKNADAYAYRGLVNFERKDFKKAQEDFEIAAKLEPLTSENFFNLAITQEKNNKPAAAIATYNKYLEIEPASADGFYNRGRLKLAQKNFSGAIKDFERAMELSERFVDAQNEIAVAYFRQKKYPDALKNLRAATETNTTNKIINANKEKLESCVRK